MISIFEELKNINKPGVFSLKNTTDNSIYINYSSNISSSLTRLINTNLFFDQYEFKVLEIVTDPIKLRIRCQYFKDWYSSNNYNIINPRRVSNWKVSVEVFSPRVGKDMVFGVKLVSGAYKQLTVGLFESYEELQSFLDLNYAGNLVTDIKYASNKLTLEYLNKCI